MSDDGTITRDTVESVRYNKNLLKAVNEISVEAGDDFTDETVLDLVREIESSNAKKQEIAVLQKDIRELKEVMVITHDQLKDAQNKLMKEGL